MACCCKLSWLLCRSVLEDLKLRWEAKLEASDVFNAEEGVVDNAGKEYATHCTPVAPLHVLGSCFPHNVSLAALDERT